MAVTLKNMPQLFHLSLLAKTRSAELAKLIRDMEITADHEEERKKEITRQEIAEEEVERLYAFD